MATEWYWLERNEEKGPVSFQELALMVQKRILNEDDLVRPRYVEEWEKAYRVVGLFYMAKRVAAPRPEETPPAKILLSADGGVSALNDQRCQTEFSAKGPISDRHRKEGGEADFPPSTEGLASKDNEPSVAESVSRSSGGPNRFAAVVTEAVKDWDRRHASLVPEVASTKRSFSVGTKLIEPFLWCGSVVTTAVGRFLDGVLRAGKLLRIGTLAGMVERLVSRQVLSWWFRGGGAVATALIVGWGIKTWSYYETLRYPNPDWIAGGMSVFPFFGACAPVEYYFMLVDVMVVGAVVGFFCAIYLEKMVDA